MKIVNTFTLLFSISILLFFSCKNNKKMTLNENPLLHEFYDTPEGVPPFDKIKIEDYLPAFKQAIKLHKQQIEQIINNTEEATFNNTILALDQSGTILSNVANIFFNLNSANTNAQMQKIAEQVSPLLSEHKDWIYMHPKLFDRVKAVYDKRDKLQLSEQDSMLLQKVYDAFVRNGALLPEDKKKELMEINKKLSVLSLKFGQNVLAETNRYKLVIENEEDLAGLPQSFVQAAAEMANKTGDSGKWVFTIQKPMLIPFLTYSERRDLREKIFKAYIMKGDHNDSLDNKEIINQIVNLRLQKANLLGYKTWADFRLIDRMAKMPKNVYELLDKIWDKALPAAKNEANQLQQMIYAQGDTFKLKPWDWWYYSEKIRQQKYQLDENQLRPYFKLENVLEKGVFYTANRLFGLTFRKAEDIPVYHPDVKVYRVYQDNDSLMAVLYLDFYPRESKRGGAWSTTYRGEYYKDGKRVPPVVSIVCNFTKPTQNLPSLLTLEEVRTLFHEIGHGLHEILTNVPYRSLAGTNVALDFVELPSQIMEEWAVSPEVLKVYARHYKTGEPISDELIKKIDNAKYFNQGFITVEYMAASYLDMDWHTIEKQKEYDVNAFEKASMDKIGLIPEIVVRYRSTYFRHVFSGGYSAGYYVYIWADVLVQDAFDYFRQKGLFDPQVANKFRHILENGGAIDPMKLYIQFRGRKPSVEPLLRSRGFIE